MNVSLTCGHNTVPKSDLDVIKCYKPTAPEASANTDEHNLKQRVQWTGFLAIRNKTVTIKYISYAGILP